MRSRTRNVLATGLVIAGLAFAPLTNAQLFEGQRSHGDSKATMIASEVIDANLDETTPAQECDDDTRRIVLDTGLFECWNVDFMSFVPNSRMFSGLPDGVSDIWGWVSPDTGDEYVIVGATTGAAAIRITDPKNPEYLGNVVNNGGPLVWFDIKINNDHAYIVSESPAFGMKILDLTLLDALPEAPAGATVPLPVTTYPLDLTSHNVVIDTDADMLYLVGSGQALGLGSVCATDRPTSTDNAGLHAIDISQPKVPVYLGCHADEGYVHDAHCTTYTGPDTEHDGKSICITAHEDGVAVVDVSDPADPVTLSDTTDEDYPGWAYSHQGWMSEDQAFYFHGDEGDEGGSNKTRTFVFDIRDLDEIKLHFINEPGGRNIDHNMYVRDGLLYQSNYTAGLQVFDTAFVDEPVLGDDGEIVANGTLPMVAEFDVYPDDQGLDPAVFAGTWSNYPYFPSGTIAVTATEDGVFFLQLDPEVRSALAE